MDLEEEDGLRLERQHVYGTWGAKHIWALKWSACSLITPEGVELVVSAAWFRFSQQNPIRVCSEPVYQHVNFLLTTF